MVYEDKSIELFNEKNWKYKKVAPNDFIKIARHKDFDMRVMKYSEYIKQFRPSVDEVIESIKAQFPNKVKKTRKNKGKVI